MSSLSPPWAHEEEDRETREKFSEAIADIQAWCPACGGSGMVMEFGPVDCPNIDQHRLLASLEASLPNSYWRI